MGLFPVPVQSGFTRATNVLCRWNTGLYRATETLVAADTAMASVTCRVQYLEDSDPFICTNFPEPRRPPTVNLEENLPLSEQIAGIHKLLEPPLKVGHRPNPRYLSVPVSAEGGTVLKPCLGRRVGPVLTFGVREQAVK